MEGVAYGVGAAGAGRDRAGAHALQTEAEDLYKRQVMLLVLTTIISLACARNTALPSMLMGAEPARLGPPAWMAASPRAPSVMAKGAEVSVTLPFLAYATES